MRTKDLDYCRRCGSGKIVKRGKIPASHLVPPPTSIALILVVTLWLPKNV